MRTRLIMILGALAVLVAVPSAVAAGTPPAPLIVQSSQLTQSGQLVTWKLTLTTPFSPAALAPGHRSLCLLLERVANGSISGQLCVLAPRPGAGHARLGYQKITRAGPGKVNVIAATVTRDSRNELSASFVPTSFGLRYAKVRWQVLSRLAVTGCVPAGGAAGCSVVFPRHPALAALHTPLLAGCVASGPPFINSGPAAGRMIALTFDDGPWYDTPQFLSILEHARVPATFFEIGDQVSTYGQGGAIERRMLADGDMVGDHTWNHANVAGGGSFAAGEISSTAAAIKQATHGFEPCLFRAPYGATSPSLISVASGLGFKTIQWDIDPRDWALPGTGAIVANVLANAHPGAIILQHDGGGNRSQTLAALPQEISALKARGYHFVTITQLLGMKLIYR